LAALPGVQSATPLGGMYAGRIRIIATEAGARVGSIDGGPLRPGSVMAAHPVLFEQLAALLDELDRGAF
ncbi:MAG TPA: hypothetical protein PLS63_10120, partial [Microthrixaceae bacterium]|nr:hypothetical protein [Microthrixaceae bacterium]